MSRCSSPVKHKPGRGRSRCLSLQMQNGDIMKLEQMSLFAGLGEKTQEQPSNKFNWAEAVDGGARRPFILMHPHKIPVTVEMWWTSWKMKNWNTREQNIQEEGKVSMSRKGGETIVKAALEQWAKVKNSRADSRHVELEWFLAQNQVRRLTVSLFSCVLGQSHLPGGTRHAHEKKSHTAKHVARWTCYRSFWQLFAIFCMQTFQPTQWQIIFIVTLGDTTHDVNSSMVAAWVWHDNGLMNPGKGTLRHWILSLSRSLFLLRW